MRESRSAISAFFHSRRSSCHVPRPRSSTNPGPAMIVGHSSRRTRERPGSECGGLLTSLMVIPERDQERFQYPQQPERRGEYQRDPDHKVQPYRRLVLDFYNERRCDDDEADDEDDEHRRAVARIVVTQIQSAAGAGLSDVKIAVK